nr:GTP cyclohydrolase, FolE2/MptA family [Thioclava electrotropha]
MPDLQNGPSSLIVGAHTRIEHVGISNFRLPVRFHTRDNGDLTLEASVTGTVSLEAEKKGINMSRVMRSFYVHAEKTFSFEVMEAALDDYMDDLESFDARLMMRVSFPVKRPSLRSGLEGWQYYDIALELIETGGVRTKVIHLDYVYSSTCPCSLELSEHARASRGQLATPHSQRSVARISAESSLRSSEKTVPSPLADEYERSSDLAITRALIIHRFEYGFSDSMGTGRPNDAADGVLLKPCGRRPCGAGGGVRVGHRAQVGHLLRQSGEVGVHDERRVRAIREGL